jgi:hypothetical protein
MFIEPRKRLIDWVRKQLVGPPEPKADGADLRGVLPTERFPCGALYPTSQNREGIDPASEDVDEVEDPTKDAGESSAEPAIVRRYIPPSSLGFSFFIKGKNVSLQVLFSAVRYKHTGDKRKNDWTRKALVSGQGNEEDFENIICPDKDQQRQGFDKLEGRARAAEYDL